jgi:hypothetical protein
LFVFERLSPSARERVLLLGAQRGCRRFADGQGPGDTCFGFIANRQAPEFEYCTLTMRSDDTLVRSDVNRSSNADRLVDF